MTINNDPASQCSDVPLELHKIISRMSRDHGDPNDMGTLGEAAARIVLLEQAVRNLLSLMEDTPYPEVIASVCNARALLSAAGANRSPDT